MNLPPSDESAAYDPLGGQLLDSRLEPFGEQSQLDFDIAFYECILQRESSYLDVLRCQGELLTRKGLHERALVIDRRLVALLPEDEVVRYNLACSLALNEQVYEALEQLRIALRFGYQDLDFLRIDSDLDNLRHLPEYHALLRDHLAALTEEG